MSPYRSEGAKYPNNGRLPCNPTDTFPRKTLCRSQENARDPQEKYVTKETNPALTPKLRKGIALPQNFKCAISPVKTSSALSPVVSLARIGDISSEKSPKFIQINKNSRKGDWNISSINEPVSPRMARSTGKTTTPRQKDVSNNSEKVVKMPRRLNYCDHRSPKNTSSVGPKKLEHSTDGKGTNAATSAAEDDLELLMNSPSLPFVNHVTLSPTVVLKRLDRVESSTNKTLETKNREESGEDNTSDQSERRTSSSSSISVKRKLLRKF